MPTEVSQSKKLALRSAMLLSWAIFQRCIVYSVEEIENWLKEQTKTMMEYQIPPMSIVIIRQLLAERKRFQYALQYIADDAETQTSGSFGMKRLAGYAKDALEGAEWLDEFEERSQIRRQAFEEAAEIADYGYDGYGKNLPSTRAICMTIADMIRCKAEEE